MNGRLRFLTAVIVCAAFSGFVESLEAGQAQRADPPPRHSPDASALKDGATDWSVIGGGAVPGTLFGAQPDRRLSIAAVTWGRILTSQRGPGPLASQFEVLLEAVPVFVLLQPQRTSGVGFSPIFLRLNFTRSPRVQPFAEIVGGILVTDREVPRGSTRFNFTPQAGVGVRVLVTRNRALLGGYRFHHISNGGRRLPNPGVNSNVVYLGVSFFR